MTMQQFEPALGPMRRTDLASGPIDWFERGSGTPLVFVHGLNTHAAHWRKVVPELAADHRCITPTLPLGSHAAPMDPGADLTPPGLADLLGELIDALALDGAVVVGNDTGGAIAQILASRRPARLGGLVLAPSDAYDRFLPWQFRWLQYAAYVPGAAWQSGQLLRSAALRRSRIGFGLLTEHGIPDDVTASYIEPLRRDSGVRRDLVMALRGIDRRHTHEAARRLADFDRPALIAWTDNPVFPLADGERLARTIPGARLEVIEGSAAFVGEDRPRDLAGAIRTFVATDVRSAPAAPGVSA